MEPEAQYVISITHPGDSDRVVSLLKEAQTLADSENVIIHYAQKFLGLPYVAHTLDQNDEECLVINTKGLDCTRQHYFTTWMTDNVADQLVSWVPLPKSPLSERRRPHVDYMSSHVSAYRMLNAHQEWLPAITAMEGDVNKTEFAYIPKAQLSNSNQYRDVIRDGDIIGIVTNKAGLDISHVGFARWHKDDLHMMHASSLQKKVIDDPTSLYGYLQRQKSAVGIVLTRVNHL